MLKQGLIKYLLIVVFIISSWFMLWNGLVLIRKANDAPPSAGLGAFAWYIGGIVEIVLSMILILGAIGLSRAVWSQKRGRIFDHRPLLAVILTIFGCLVLFILWIVYL
jgi:flagellar biosynthesis protein FlhB